MDLSLVEQHHVVFPDLLALFNTWANKSQGDSEYWRKVSSGKLHQGQGSLTLSGGTKDAHLVAPCVWLPEATMFFHKSLGLVSLAGIVMHYMENGGLGNGTFIIWAWLGSTRISRQVLSRWSWRQGRRMTKLCRSSTPPCVLRRAEHEGLCTSSKNHNGRTWTGWAGGCWWAVGREGSTTVTKVADSLFWQRFEPRVLCMLGSGGRPSSHTPHYSILHTWGRSRSLQQYSSFFRNWFSICFYQFS